VLKTLLRMIQVALLVLVPRAAAAEELLSADEAYAMARSGRLTIIDVRTPQEWRETGTPEGAVRANFQAGTEAFVAAVTAALDGDRTKPLAVICRSGNRSAQARQTLRAAGFTQVHDIGEGMSGGPRGPGWLRRGLPVTPDR